MLSILPAVNVDVACLKHAAEYCDYLYVMKNGQLAASGKPEDRITKELIGHVFDVSCQTYHNPVTGGLGMAYLGMRQLLMWT
jgi:iron complex transport system ATP-binding protein